MTNVLTVEAKLNGSADGLVGAAKRGAAAIKSVEDAALDAARAGGRMDAALTRVGFAIGTAVRGVGTFGANIARVGARAVATLVQITTRAVMAGAALATVFGGAAIKAGLDRLMSIQDATVALTRMLGGAAEAAELTGKVLDVVKGTPFAFPQFAEATRQLVAFGVKAEMIPGVLKAVADSAAASGEGAEAVGRITQAFSRMAVTGRMSYEVVEALGTAGVNALGILANHFGVTAEEARDMASSGLIPAEEAMAILVDGIENGSKGAAGDFKALGGAAQDLGKTVSGSLGNVKAAFARMGASWLKPFEDDLPDVLNKGVIPLLDKLGEAGERAMKKVADTGLMDKALNLFEKLIDGVEPGIETFLKFAKAFSPLMVVFEALKGVMPEIQDSLSVAAQVVAEDFIPALADILEAAVPLLPALVDLGGALIDGLVSILPTLIPMIEGLVGAFVGVVDVVGGLPPELLGIVTALLALNAAGLPVFKVLGDLASGLIGIVSGGAGVSGLITGVGDVLVSTGGKADGFKGKLSGVASALTGGAAWGVALAGAGIMLDALAEHFLGPIRRAEELQRTFDDLTGATTEATRVAVASELEKSGAYERSALLAKAMGVTESEAIKLVTDAAMGNKAARDQVNAAIDGTNAKYGTSLQVFGSLLDAINGENDAINRATEAQAHLLIATGAVDNANRLFSESLASAAEAAKLNGASLDENTAAGQANAAQIENVNKAAQDMLLAMENSGASTDEMAAAQDAAVPKLVATYESMGMASDAARDLAAKVLGIPTSRAIKVTADVSDARARLDGILAAYQNRSVTLRAVMHYADKLANGGVVQQANGGVTKRFAGGGFNALGQAIQRVPQMVNGGANILWGEPETGWEAYISGKKSMLQRNRRVWADAGKRLGMFDGPAGGGGGTVINVNVDRQNLGDEHLGNEVASLLKFALN